MERSMYASVVPQFSREKFAVVDLEAEARDWVRKNGGELFLEPLDCQRMIDAMHRRLGVAWSYGGYMEDRPTLGKGSYLERDQSFLHLGVDINVPSGTHVAASDEAEVLCVDDDRDEEIGWGPRVMLRPRNRRCPVLVYAHLSRGIRCRMGEILQPGHVFAEVGSPPTNGNVFPHVHVQAVTRSYFRTLLEEDFVGFDGYCPLREGAQARERFPDPVPFIGLPIFPG